MKRGNEAAKALRTAFDIRMEYAHLGVSTYFEKETSYKLSINVNNVSILNQSGFARPGYWTIDLLNPISLNVGDIFEIIFKINVTGDVGVPISEAVIICLLNITRR